jgi:RES domain-containing protein
VISVWRIVKEEYARAAFDGNGAAMVSGRWNSRGVKMVYAAGSLSLAALELFVHLERNARDMKFVYIRADVPGHVKIGEVRPGGLPKDWRSYPAPESTRRIGDGWIKKGETLLFKVPSVIVPSESDYLIDPDHHDFKSVRFNAPEPFFFDQRMWR